MAWRLLADLMVGLHFAFLAYLIVGGFLAWRWPRTIWLHLVTAAWGLLIIVVQVPCPLTWAQNEFRDLGGQSRLRDGFIQVYVRGTFYPAQYERASQIVVGAIVAASWIGFAVVRRRRRTRHAPHPIRVTTSVR
jgi:hypothetical protein